MLTAVLLKDPEVMNPDLCLSLLDWDPLPPSSLSAMEHKVTSLSLLMSCKWSPTVYLEEYGHIQPLENRVPCGPPGPALATLVLTLSFPSSLQICLGDVMMNRVVDEVGWLTQHPSPWKHPFQCMALAGHLGHLALCDGSPLCRAVLIPILRDKNWVRPRWLQGAP